MKGLSIEEKAKRFDEAIKRAKGVIEQNPLMEYLKKGIEYIFPELKENEDERIRKALINGFNKLDKSAVWYNGVTNGQILDWLEKQGEQKPTDVRTTGYWHVEDVEQNPTDEEIKELLRTEYEKGRADAIAEQKSAWSEEDEMFVHGLIRGLAAKRDIHGHTTFSSDCINITETINWLKSLKQRVQPQPKSDWGEEDEKISKAIIKCINGESDYLNVDLSSAICWIKNVKDRVQPKQEWNKEDETFLNTIISDLDYSKSIHNKAKCNFINKEIKWLNSLRPQNRWKPSDTEINILQGVIDGSFKPENVKVTLTNILEQLKKLREE